MRTLNDPVGLDDTKHDDWTLAIGLRRAVLRGGIAAVVVGVLFGTLAHFLPILVTHNLIRIAIGFTVMVVVLGAVQRGAGMVGWLCTGMAAVLSALVMYVNYIVCVWDAVQSPGGELMIWGPPVLVFNVSALVGITIAGVIGHRGEAIGGFVGDLLTSNPLSPRR